MLNLIKSLTKKRIQKQNKLIKEVRENKEVEAYIKSLELEDIRSWTKESQEAYIRARLKIKEERQKLPKEERLKLEKDDHWDLF